MYTGTTTYLEKTISFVDHSLIGKQASSMSFTDEQKQYIDFYSKMADGQIPYSSSYIIDEPSQQEGRAVNVELVTPTEAQVRQAEMQLGRKIASAPRKRKRLTKTKNKRQKKYRGKTKQKGKAKNKKKKKPVKRKKTKRNRY